MSDHRPLILASASPRRKYLLGLLGVPFEVRPADVDETIKEGANPEIAARVIARTKAEAARLADMEAPILAADTIVVLDGRILGKPVDEAEARAMLESLRNREHTVITAIALMPRGTTQPLSRHSLTTVRMRDFSDAEIDGSIRAGEPFDKAGGYAIQDSDFVPVEAYNGCYCNVMGLPLWPVADMLRKTGLWHVPDVAQLLPQCAECPLRPPAD